MGISRTLRRKIKETIKLNDIRIEEIDCDPVWSISSARDPETSYFVVSTNSECVGSSDLGGLETDRSEASNGSCIAFTLSKSCRHIYSCGCHDYLNGQTCKHILKIAAYRGLWKPASVCLHTNQE